MRRQKTGKPSARSSALARREAPHVPLSSRTRRRRNRAPGLPSSFGAKRRMFLCLLERLSSVSRT
ncbi:MAG: hypothetical protein LBD06_07070 [Candidatus Accumulibacter sp.]|nr:hypothetical protein [Accumulibacter sp.]